ncbi:MAG TPA: hypothetical protein PLR99_13845 [Polyangiaceae bacterium]|jgi:hypothetical protein|nr:hypothetical protein [Polyangiaceae bacterium]
MTSPTGDHGDRDDDDALLAEVVGARRPPPLGGALRYHPAWADLSPQGREEAHRITMGLRAAEAALDPDGLSTTSRLVLARIRAATK